MEWDGGTGQWFVSFPELEQDRIELGPRVADCDGSDPAWIAPGRHEDALEGATGGG